MHVNWKHLAIGLAILPVAVLFATWIGFFNVGASTGHWKITEWFLHFAMRSAVRTYALAVEAPDELPRYAIQPAAGHFARGCAICHGAPGEPRSPAVHLMLPQPPDLAGKVGEWTDAELFRIVKHGVRFTGMPAWPTQQRDDEVWAMIAFLRELPTMDEATWRDLAYGSGAPPDRPDAGLRPRARRMHALPRRGRRSAAARSTPVLAGQSETYLLESLRGLCRRPPPERRHGHAGSRRRSQALRRRSPGIFPPCPRRRPPRRPMPALVAAGEEIARRRHTGARRAGLPRLPRPARTATRSIRSSQASPPNTSQPS